MDAGGLFGFTFGPFTEGASEGGNSPVMNFSIFGESSPAPLEQDQRGSNNTGQGMRIFVQSHSFSSAKL